MGFTLIVIDCSPSLSSSVTSTMCAADQVVIPVNSDIFSIRGLEMTLDEVNKVCDAFKIDPPDTRILFSKYDTREKLCVSALHKLSSDERYSRMLLPTFIRTCAELPKVTNDGETVFASQKSSSARDDYDMYACHLLGFNNLKQREV
jgi:chromosome partitioning protein